MSDLNEKLFVASLEEFSWGQARERERANRGKVCVLVSPGGRVVCSRSKTVTLEPVTATMVNVRRYAVEDAAGAAVSLSKVGGKVLAPIDVYEFAKLRQYCARSVILKHSKESK